MIGATVAVLPHPDVMPAASVYAKAPPLTDADVPDPWALRDGLVASTEQAEALGDAWHPLWARLFERWAARRARYGHHTIAATTCVPTAVPRGRTPRDALYDLLSIYDVWSVGGDRMLRLHTPSAIPSAHDIVLAVQRHDAGADIALPRAQADLAQLAERGVGVFYVVVQTLGDGGAVITHDAYSINTVACTIDNATTVDTHVLYVRWFAGSDYADSRPDVWGTPEMAATRCTFRVYGSAADGAVPVHGPPIEVDSAFESCAMFRRLVPTTDMSRPQRPPLVRDNQQLLLAMTHTDGIDATAMMEAVITAQFTLSTGAMTFDTGAQWLRGPGNAPAAFFLYENDQWSRRQAPVVCTEPQAAPPAIDDTLVAPLPPPSSQRQRFGHTLVATSGQPVPLSLGDERNYFVPLPMRTLYTRRPAWIGLHIDGLHPHPVLVEQTAHASMSVLDPDQVLRRSGVQAILVLFRLQWRPTETAPFSTHHLPLRFQLVHADGRVYAYAGLPEVAGVERQAMPRVVRRVV